MVTSTLTEKQIEAGKKLVHAGDTSDLKIDSAMWIFFKDQESWKLLLSIKGIEKTGPKSIYNKLQKLITKTEIGDQISLSEVMLAKPRAPLLELMRVAIKTGPGISGISFTGNVINGQLIPDSYIYRLN
jgi:hypothetical protein